jgi:hypothetical protein
MLCTVGRWDGGTMQRGALDWKLQSQEVSTELPPEIPQDS